MNDARVNLLIIRGVVILFNSVNDQLILANTRRTVVWALARAINYYYVISSAN
jgi:hypothetical protein